MASVVRIGKSGGGCCPCSEQVGCDCSAIPCSSQCRYKGGIASLCGFSEFVDPSVPPKKYLQRRLTQPMEHTEYPFTTTCVNPCNGGLRLSWTNPENTCVANGGFAVQSETPTTVTYVCTDVSFVCGGVGLECFMNAGPHGVAPGDTVTRSKGSCWDISIWVNSVTWHPVVSGSVMVGQPDLIRDDWAYQGNYNKDTCVLTETDGSTRQVGANAPIPLPCDNPISCYPTATISLSPDERVVTGLDCVVTVEGGSSKMSGAVFDVLEFEDREDYAISRAKAALEWSAPNSCSASTMTKFKTIRGAGDFSLAFRDIQFKITAGSSEHLLVIGHVYRISVRFGHRPLGTSLEFKLSETLEIDFVAAHTIEVYPSTDPDAWIDMIGDEGYETKLLGCSVKDIT
jgi:hypothetical protein